MKRGTRSARAYYVADNVTTQEPEQPREHLHCYWCGERPGPWLLVAWHGSAWATCTCGYRVRDQLITAERVLEGAQGQELRLEPNTNVDQLERDLGFYDAERAKARSTIAGMREALRQFGMTRSGETDPERL